MTYTNHEAIVLHDRILELCGLYDLSIQNACIRVQLNPTSWISLVRRVKRIRATIRATQQPNCSCSLYYINPISCNTCTNG